MNDSAASGGVSQRTELRSGVSKKTHKAQFLHAERRRGMLLLKELSPLEFARGEDEFDFF
jgi:hypothetical protein